MKAEVGTRGLISMFVGPSAAPRLYHGVVGGSCSLDAAGGGCRWSLVRTRGGSSSIPNLTSAVWTTSAQPPLVGLPAASV